MWYVLSKPLGKIPPTKAIDHTDDSILNSVDKHASEVDLEPRPDDLSNEFEDSDHTSLQNPLPAQIHPLTVRPLGSMQKENQLRRLRGCVMQPGNG
jgi:hypothetical protein